MLTIKPGSNRLVVTIKRNFLTGFLFIPKYLQKPLKALFLAFVLLASVVGISALYLGYVEMSVEKMSTELAQKGGKSISTTGSTTDSRVRAARAAEDPVTEPDPICIGTELADYVNEFFTSVGSVGNYGDVYFLTPALNATYPGHNELVQAMKDGGVDFNSFYAVAVNAYYEGASSKPSDKVAAVKTSTGNSRAILTETGLINTSRTEANFKALGADLSGIISDENFLGAALFNVFGTGNSEFSFHTMTTQEIQWVCEGATCKRTRGGYTAGIGANSARYYSTAANIFYDPAAERQMGITVEIGQNDADYSLPALMPGLRAANDRGMTPVIRLGVGESGGGFEPGAGGAAALATFVQNLDALVDFRVYVIIGPNEPNSECWASPECGCELDEGSMVKIHGKVTNAKVTYDKNNNPAASMPIRGAALGMYQPYDTNGQKNDAGQDFGLLELVAIAKTDGNGDYELSGTVGELHEESVFVYAWCGSTLVDQWKINVTESVREFDFYVPCDSSDYTEARKPPELVALNAMGDKTACTSVTPVESDSYGNKQIAPGSQFPINLVAKDVDDSFLGCSSYPGCLPPSRVYETEEELLGRQGPSRVSVTYNEIPNYVIGMANWDRVKPRLLGEEKDEDVSLTDQLDKCEDIKSCSNPMSISPSAEGRNNYTCYGSGIRLQSPVILEKLYETANKEQDVCLDENNDPVKLCEIAPPGAFKEENRQETCGEFKYDSSYFPYAELFGGGDTGGDSTSYNENPKDSYDCTNGVSEECFRDLAYDTDPTETGSFGPNQNETRVAPGGRSTFSKQTDSISANTQGALAYGLLGPILGLKASPVFPYGFDSAATTGYVENPYLDEDNPNSSIQKVGRGDFQLRPYEACTVNTYDPEYQDPLNNFFPDDDFHLYQNSHRYLTQTGVDAMNNRVLELLGQIFPFLRIHGLRFGLLESVRAAYNIMDSAANDGKVVAQIEGASAQQYQGFHNGVHTFSDYTCIPLSWRDGDGDCNKFECRSSSVCTNYYTDPNTGVGWCLEYQTTNEIRDVPGAYGEGEWSGRSECIGDLRTTFQASMDMYGTPLFDRATHYAAATEARAYISPSVRQTPFQGMMVTIDYLTKDEEELGRDTLAFHTTGVGGPTSYLSQVKSQVKPPRLECNPSDESCAAPEWGEPLPSATKPNMRAPLGSGTSSTGTDGSYGEWSADGDGSCSLVPAGPCSVASLMASGAFGGSEAAAKAASMICNAESAAKADNDNLACLQNGTYDYSIGLFQINLVPGAGGIDRCNWAANYFKNNYTQLLDIYADLEDRFPFPDVPTPTHYAGCKPMPDAERNNCVDLFHLPVINLEYASILAGCNADGSSCNWMPWACSAEKCGIIQADVCQYIDKY